MVENQFKSGIQPGKIVKHFEMGKNDSWMSSLTYPSGCLHQQLALNITIFHMQTNSP